LSLLLYPTNKTANPQLSTAISSMIIAQSSQRQLKCQKVFLDPSGAFNDNPVGMGMPQKFYIDYMGGGLLKLKVTIYVL
jgi:hypothetical protein